MSSEGARILRNDKHRGVLVRLEEMTTLHAGSLLASITSEEVWEWKPVAQPLDTEDMRNAMSGWLGHSDRKPFVVFRQSDNRVIGSTTVYDIDIRQGRAEIGGHGSLVTVGAKD
jgi:N-acetyltransferase